MQPDYFAPNLVRDDSRTETFLGGVYRWMAVGLSITGLVAMFVASTPSLLQLIFTTPLFWALIAAQFILAIAFGPMASRVSPVVAGGMFVLYAAVTGATLSSIFLAYTATSIASTFFVTAGTFGAMSAYGALTKRSLSGFGTFLMMGLIGVVLASVVNLFLHSTAVAWLASFAGIIVFTGLIAYDTQRLKNMAPAFGPNGAVQGALMLYLDFVNLFLSLLRIFGSRRD